MDKKLLLSKYSNTLKLNNRNDSIILFKTTGSKINFTTYNSKPALKIYQKLKLLNTIEIS